MPSTQESARTGERVSVRSAGVHAIRVSRNDHFLYVPRDVALELADLIVDSVERWEIER